MPYAWTAVALNLAAFVLFVLPAARRNPLTLNVGCLATYSGWKDFGSGASARAAQAWHDAPSAFHQTSQRLLPEEARRLESLRRMATPMSHAEAMAHPLTLLPPARVRLLNPAHALQVLLTRLLLGGAYARRMADVATLLPAAARRPYALLMNTLLARRLAPGWSASASSVRHALEDAWSHPLVLQRWAPFVQTLSRTQCERVVQRAIQRGWAGSGVRWLPEDQATDGWELPTAGRTHAASLAQTSQTSQTSHEIGRAHV